MSAPRKIVVWGGSHARRIQRCLYQKLEKQNYCIIDRTFPGLSLSNMSSFPRREVLTLNKDDILIIQVGGNDTFQKGEFKIPRKNSNIFHLDTFLPNSEEYLKNLYSSLSDVLHGLKCRILIIDNPNRHLFCCSKHAKYKNIMIIQAAANKILRSCLKESAQVLSHIKVFGISCKVKRRPKLYAKLQPDSVHFEPELYERAAVYLIDNFIKRKGL